MTARQTITFSFVSAFMFATLGVGTAAAEDVAPPDAFPAEITSEDTPDCLGVSAKERGSTILHVDNQCTEPVTIDLLDCRKVNCDTSFSLDVAAGEKNWISAQGMGIDPAKVRTDRAFNLTFGWSKDPDDEGMIEMRVEHVDTSPDSGGCGGCGAEPIAGRSQPPVGTFAVLWGGLVLLRRWKAL